MNLCYLRVAAVAALWLAGCGTDAVTLPPDYNERRIKVIEVDYGAEVGPVSLLSGLQGSPAPTVDGDTNLTARFDASWADIVRVPEGYLCRYTLSGVFPNRTRDAADLTAYDFEQIDPIFEATANLRPAGRPVKRLYQAMYDYGLDTCSVDPQGTQFGEPPQDMARWTTVVVNVLRHFNQDLLTEGSPGFDEARDFDVRYVEYYPDPLGRGGYETVEALVTDFTAFAQAVKAAFPDEEDGTPVMHVVGPAMAFDSPGAVATDLEPFLDALEAAGTLDLLDVVSFEVRADHPIEILRVAEAVRAAVDEREITAPVWLTRYQATEGRFPEPVLETETSLWSIQHGAFTTATRILLQGVVDDAVFWRGDRRRLSSDSIEKVERTPLWDGRTGSNRPGGIAWLPWQLLFSESKVRVQVGDVATADEEGLAVLAVSEPDRDCGEGESSVFSPEPNVCPRLFLLIANANTHLGQSQLTYQITITGVGETRQVTVRRSFINAGTDDFFFDSQTKVSVADGSLSFQVESAVPSVDFIQIDL